MKEKKQPLRMCIACRQMKDKRELVRIVRAPDGSVSLDMTGKKNGRGAYVCPSDACIKKCVKAKLAGRTLGCEIPDEVYLAIAEDFAREKGQN